MDMGYNIKFVGHPKYSLTYDEIGEDCRSDNIEVLIKTLKQSKLLFLLYFTTN